MSIARRFQISNGNFLGFTTHMILSQLMGIVNINDDSFSHDGTLDPGEALILAQQHILNGADIIDIGAESARTNRGAIPVTEEIERLQSFLAGWPHLLAATAPERKVRLSLNTWRPEVIAGVLPLGGVDILNDISGLPDATNARLARQHGVTLLIMHSVGEPKVPHLEQTYDDVWQAMEVFFEEKIALAGEAGLDRSQLILDPGIDFAKQREDNLAIYRELSRLQRFDLPVVLPISRKTVIGEVLGIDDPAQRDAGTVACLTAAEAQGRHIYRVHNVRAARQALDILEAVRDV